MLWPGTVTWMFMFVVIRVQVFDVSLFDGDRVPEDTLRRFFTHSLMRVLTYRPVYKGETSVRFQIHFLHFAFMFCISEGQIMSC